MDGEMICGGCGRHIVPPEDLPDGARFLCSRCLFMLALPLPGVRVAERERPIVWSTRVIWIGFALILAAGMTPSLLFGYFTGRVYIGYIMAFSFLLVLGVPAWVALFRKLRNLQLNQAVLYSLMGPWLLTWSFLPGVDPGQGRTLLWFGGAATALGLVFLVLTLYSMRAMPRA